MDTIVHDLEQILKPLMRVSAREVQEPAVWRRGEGEGEGEGEEEGEGGCSSVDVWMVHTGGGGEREGKKESLIIPGNVYKCSLSELQIMYTIIIISGCSVCARMRNYCGHFSGP